MYIISTLVIQLYFHIRDRCDIFLEIVDECASYRKIEVQNALDTTEVVELD